MDIVELLNCAKPLIFENREAEFRYSIQGTCFLVRFQSRQHAITARHCLLHRKLESIRVRLSPGRLEFLRLKALVTPKGNDKDALDLAVMEIEPASLPIALLESSHFLDLNDYAERSLGSKEILCVVGYPTEHNSANYETFVIRTQGFSADGHYDGQGEDAGCSRIRFNDLTPVEDLNGLSGSPVLAFEQIGERTYRHHFAGVLIRATRSSGTGRFINSGVIMGILQHLS
jgi:hypothetical protein